MHEIHITVNHDQIDTRDWMLLCRAFHMRNYLDIKPLYFQLFGNAKHWYQVMCSIKEQGLTDAEAINEAERFAAVLESPGRNQLEVLRIKVEAPLHTHKGQVPDGGYTEMHLKASVPLDMKDLVVSLGTPSLGVSESLPAPLVFERTYVPPPTHAKLYLTERLHAPFTDYKYRGHNGNIQTFSALKYHADTYELYEPLATGYHAEVVLYDSNPAMDAGWLN